MVQNWNLQPKSKSLENWNFIYLNSPQNVKFSSKFKFTKNRNFPILNVAIIPLSVPFSPTDFTHK